MMAIGTEIDVAIGTEVEAKEVAETETETEIDVKEHVDHGGGEDQGLIQDQGLVPIPEEGQEEAEEEDLKQPGISNQVVPLNLPIPRFPEQYMLRVYSLI